jgi:hypothetical protein
MKDSSGFDLVSNSLQVAVGFVLSAMGRIKILCKGFPP